MKIIVKVLSQNKGIVLINDIKYNLNEYNQILEIDTNNNKIFKIKAIDNDFILAVKRQIKKEYIEYAQIEKNYQVPFNTDKKFIIYNLDYNNYDYASFYFVFGEEKKIIIII